MASTRVLLPDSHHAGRVIEAFGHVVIGGNFVVGLLLFVPLMIINFMMMTNSSDDTIITRDSDSGDMQEQINNQLRASLVALYSAAGMMFMLAIIPGMPWLTFRCR